MIKSLICFEMTSTWPTGQHSASNAVDAVHIMCWLLPLHRYRSLSEIRFCLSVTHEIALLIRRQFIYGRRAGERRRDLLLFSRLRFACKPPHSRLTHNDDFWFHLAVAAGAAVAPRSHMFCYKSSNPYWWTRSAYPKNPASITQIIKGSC